MKTVAEIKIGPTTATDLTQVSRKQLEMVAAGVLALQCYHITDLVGISMGFLTTAADVKLVDKVIKNLRAVKDSAVTLEDIAAELNHRHWYAMVYPTQTIQIFQV